MPSPTSRPDGRRTSSATPSLKAVADYWRALPEAKLESTFPRIAALFIGWGEPFCFKCGWLAPCPDGPASWPGAAGWLEVAHLADWALTGASDPVDCVPLCIACHNSMPSFADRDKAVEWVALGRKNEWTWQAFTDSVWREPREVPGNKRSAINDALRAYQTAMDSLAQ